MQTRRAGCLWPTRPVTHNKCRLLQQFRPSVASCSEAEGNTVLRLGRTTYASTSVFTKDADVLSYLGERGHDFVVGRKSDSFGCSLGDACEPPKSD